MTLISWLAPLSSWLVMLHLGLAAHEQQTVHFRLPSVGFWLAHYVAPLLIIATLSALGILNTAEILGLVVCVLSGAGTSVSPWAQRDGATPTAIAHRLAIGAIIALITIPALAFFHSSGTIALQQAAKIILLLIGLFYLPWVLGRIIAKRQPIAAHHQTFLGRAAMISVAALITLVAATELPNLPGNITLILAAFGAVTISGCGGVLVDTSSGLATTAVVKNITLTILVLSADASTYTSLSAVAAFGAWMYIMVWPTSFFAQKLKQSMSVAS